MDNHTTDMEHKNLRKMIRAYMEPRIMVLRSKASSAITTLLDQVVRFIGGMSAVCNIAKSDYERNLLIETVVNNDSHVHATSQIEGSVDATPNTLVKRDSLGRIKGGGTYYGSTGFKLSNGVDISNLFRNINTYPANPVNKKSGSGNYTNSITISFNTSNNVLTLSRNLASFCTVNKHPDVEKDGCD